MAYTASLPTWNKVGVAPIAAKQTAGWGVNEHPPADWFNWQWNLTFLALQELQTNAIHKDGSGTFTGQIKSTLATGTAPLSVASTTLVANLNADMVDGFQAQAAYAINTVPVRDASGDLTTRRFISNVATGTAPFGVTSTTVVPNLNVDQVDGFHMDQDVRIAASPTHVRVTLSQVTGTAPLTVASTTLVTNLNADMADGFHFDQDVRIAASPTFVRATFSQATGTAPFTVTSTTKVANLNADQVDGLDTATAATVNTIAARDASANLTANVLVSTVAIGTAPLTVTSTTVVPNLNADTTDGWHMNQDVRTTASPTFVTPTVTRLISTQATGTAPFTVASQTLVSNLNSDQLDGLHADTAATVNTVSARDASGDITARRFVSGLATGTSPLSVTSTTVNANLNADMADGFHFDQDVRTTASPTFVTPTVTRLTLTQATGTAPLTVTSTTVVTNLNADQVDGFHMDQDVRTTASPTFVVPSVTRLTSTQATGTAPFTVASTTMVANLNVERLNGQLGSYYAPINSPIFTGSPKATTPSAGDNSTNLSTTAYVDLMTANSPAPTAVNFGNGMQVVAVTKSAPYNVLNIQGFTLLNMLGRDGNFDNGNSNWAGGNATIALDTANKTLGTNGLKITISSSLPVAFYVPKVLLSGKYYVALADVKNGNTSGGVTLGFNAGGTTAAVTGTTAFTTLISKVNTSDGLANVEIRLTGSSTQYAYVDAVRIYEVSAAEYAAITVGVATAAQIAKYPYVDDLKHVSAPYVIKYGENLIPPLSDWVMHGNAAITDPYSFVLYATANSQSSYCSIPCNSNQTYTINVAGSGRLYVKTYDINSNLLSLPVSNVVAGSYTFTTDANAKSLIVYLENATLGAGTYTFSNIVLNLGSTIKPFRPRNDDMIAFPNVQLASSVDGTCDTLFKRDGKFFVEKRFKDILLDGSLAWTLGADYTGFKMITLSGFLNAVPLTQRVVKWDGKIVPTVVASWNSADLTELNYASTGNFNMTIADTESGWGETYSPTTQEIQAYFYGWKMYDTNTGNTAVPYTRGDNQYKGWCRVGTMTNGTGIIPVASYAGYTPYKLTHQLIAPTFEEIQAEGGMSLHEGNNQIEVGQGLFVREKANPLYDAGLADYVINRIGVNQLKNRTNRAVVILRNGLVDRKWYLTGGAGASDPNWYGGFYARCRASDFDPTATYEVTYVAFDQNLVSAPVQAVTGDATSNLKTIVDILSMNDADQDARISAAEIRLGGMWGENTTNSRGYVRSVAASTQSISANTLTKVTNMTNKVGDNLSEYDAISTQTYTAKTDGLYLLVYQVAATAGVASGNIIVTSVNVGGSNFDLTSYQTSSSAIRPVFTGSRILKLTAGQVLSFYINSTVALSLTGDSATTFTIVKIA